MSMQVKQQGGCDMNLQSRRRNARMNKKRSRKVVQSRLSNHLRRSLIIIEPDCDTNAMYCNISLMVLARALHGQGPAVQPCGFGAGRQARGAGLFIERLQAGAGYSAF